MVFQEFKVLLIVACGLAAGTAGPALGQFVELNNGIPRTTDGHLRVNPDAFGSWAASGFGGQGDQYNPPGGGPPLAPKQVIFSNGFFLFKDGTQRELLAESTNFQNSVPADASLEREITSPNTVNAGVATSSFRVFDPVGSFDVSFDLEQSITQVGMTTASFLSQTYTMTNNSGEAVAFELVRAVDADLQFAPGQQVTDDQVGTNTHATSAAGVTSVFQQDAVNAIVSALTLSGENNGGAYYGGKNGVDPGNAGFPYGVGTSTEVWDSFGVPTNWRNHIANVGYDIDGLSGTGNADAFMGLEFPVNLATAESQAITLVHTYGDIPGDAIGCDFDSDGNCNGTDINMLMAAIAGGGGPEFDLNSDGSVDNGDRDQWLVDAGTMNIGAAYLIADANLDGIVDGLDFIEWNNNKFTANTDWTGGEFTGDATVDGLDFIEWNTNKFQSSMDLATVPEPSTTVLLAMLMVSGGAIARRRQRWPAGDMAAVERTR